MPESALFTFLVLGEGGTPLYTLPKYEDKKTTLLTSLVSASGGLTERISGESNILYLESGDMYLLRKKIKGISFVLISSKAIEKAQSKKILTKLANEFGKRYGFDLDRVQRGKARGDIDFTEFNYFVTRIFTEKIGATAYFQFKEVIRNLHSKLQDENVDIRGEKKHFTQVQVPILLDKEILEQKEDGKQVKILQLCNEERSTQEIAEKLDLSRFEVMQFLSKLKKEGAIEFKTKFKLNI